MRRDELKALDEQRLQLVQELRTFHDEADKRAGENGGEWSAEDDEEYVKREKDLVTVNARREKAYRTASLTRFDPAKDELKALEPGGAPQTLAEFRSGIEGPPVSDLPDVRAAIFSWIVHGREGMELEEFRVLSKAASGGAYMVPTELADQIVRALRFLPGGVAALAREIVTASGDTFYIPLDLTHGTAAWVAESGSYTPSDETFTQGSLGAYKAGTKIIVSEELMTDSAFDLSGFLATEFGERIGLLAETAYISGDGSGKPTGILNGSVVTRSTLPAGQVTTTTLAAIMAAVYSVPTQYRGNMAILASDSLWVRLATLADSTGRLVWSPSTGEGVPDRLQGIPIYAHPTLAAIGANSESAIVGDFQRGYWIRRVNSVFMQRQNELHSDNGQVGFRAYLRVDGNVVLPDALRVIKFAAT